MYAQLSILEKNKNNKFYGIFWNTRIIFGKIIYQLIGMLR